MKGTYSYPRTVFLPAGGTQSPVGSDTWEAVFTNVEPERYQDLIDLFENEEAEAGWYLPSKEYPLDPDFSEDKMTDIDRYNVHFIYDEEYRRQ